MDVVSMLDLVLIWSCDWLEHSRAFCCLLNLLEKNERKIDRDPVWLLFYFCLIFEIGFRRVNFWSFACVCVRVCVAVLLEKDKRQRQSELCLLLRNNKVR